MGKDKNPSARDGGAPVQEAMPGIGGGKAYVATGFVNGEAVSVELEINAQGFRGDKTVRLKLGEPSPDGVLHSTARNYEANNFASYNNVKTLRHDAVAFKGLGALGDMVSDQFFEAEQRRNIANQAPALVAEFEKAMLGGETPGVVTPKEFNNIIKSFQRIDQSPDGIGAHAPQGKTPPASTARVK